MLFGPFDPPQEVLALFCTSYGAVITVIVGLLSLAGTALGTGGGILASARLTNFRISCLEKKVDEHNNYGKRIPVMEEKIKVINHRIEDLEHEA